MDDELVRFEKMASHARKEARPEVNVTQQVIRSLRSREEVRYNPMERPLLVFSLASLVSAVIMVLIALDGWRSLSDPLGQTIHFMAMVMQ